MAKEGRYMALAREHFWQKMGGENGKQLVKKYRVMFELLEGPNVGARVPFDGGIGTDKAKEFTAKALEACGYVAGTPMKSAKLDKKVFVEVVNEEYQDKNNEKKYRSTVKYVNSVDDANASMERFKVSDAEADEFEAEFVAAIKAKREGQMTSGSLENGPMPEDGGPPIGAPDPDGDIPF